MSDWTILYQAVENGDKTKILDVLRKDINLKSIDIHGKSKIKDDVYTSLRNAMLKTAFVNEPDEEGLTFAHKFFIQHPSLERLELLKDGDADFSAFSYYHGSFLHLASQHSKSVELIDFLVNEKCQLNVTNYRCVTPLRVAIKYRNENVAVRLIELGADVNEEYGGESPLSWACSMGLVQVAKKLIEYGADLDRNRKDSKTLLHLSMDYPKMVELLVKSGLDVNVKDRMGRTPLHRAIIEYSLSYPVIQILLKAGAHVDARDDKNNSPLYYATGKGNKGYILELLKYGADATDSKIFANLSKNSWKYEYLNRYLVKLNAANLLGRIPLELSKVDKKFHNLCLTEVEMLKTFFIDDRTSLYDLLHKNRDRRCAYLHNEKLKNLVDDVEIGKKFPEYFAVIMGCYNEAKTRKSLVQPAKDAWLLLTNFHLPDLCIDQILTYLSNGNLIQLIEANEVVTVDI